MKKFLLLFFSIVLIIISQQEAKASHAMGGDIYYRCIDPTTSTYEIVYSFYRDCIGATAPFSIPITISSASCGLSISATLVQDTCPPGPGAPCEVSPLCAELIDSSCCATPRPTGCLPGVMQFTYRATIMLPAMCTDWIISYSICCRNAAITNLSSTPSLYLQSLLNNTLGCNNSPRFTTLPVPYICVNQPFNYNHGVIDDDGDSLHYSLIDPLSGPATPIGHVAPFSATYPMSTASGTFSFDSLTGQMNFIPDVTQVAVITILVEEYRGGVLIGSTMRDLQIVVVNFAGCSNPSPRFFGIEGSSVEYGTFIDTFRVDVCPGDTLKFDFTAKELAGDTLIMTTNIGLSIPDATVVDLPTPRDSTAAKLIWYPLPTDTGANFFIVNIANNSCPIAANLSYALEINVLPGTDAGPDRDYCIGGVPAQLRAIGGSMFTWTPSTGLDDPTIKNPKATPTTTTTYYVQSNLSSVCKNRDTVVVNVVPGFTWDLAEPVPDTICANGLSQLSVRPDATEAPYNITWSPNTSLNADSVYEPLANPQITTTYVVNMVSDEGCRHVDSTTLYVDGIAPYVELYASDLVVCPGDTVDLNGLVTQTACGINPAGVGMPFDCASAGGTFDFQTVGTAATSATFPSPFMAVYNATRYQTLIRADEMRAAGLSFGVITDLIFNVITKNSTTPLDSLTISIGCTSDEELIIWQTGLQEVYSPKNYTTFVGLNTLNLDRAYDWDGTSNLVIEVCFTNVIRSSSDAVQYTATPYNSVLYATSFSSVIPGCNLLTSTPSTFRPNIGFFMCEIPPVGITYSWSPLANVFTPTNDTTAAIINKDLRFVLTANDGMCDGGNFIDIKIDSSYYLTAGPDMYACNGTPVTLGGGVVGMAPGSQLSCGQNNTNSPFPPVTVQVGNMTSTSNLSPFYGANTGFADTIEDQRTQMLILASNLTADGLTTGIIRELQIQLNAKVSEKPYRNLNLRLGCTSATELVLGSWLPTDLVYTDTAYATSAGWNSFTLLTPWDWDGSSNIVVEICWDAPDAGSPPNGIDPIQGSIASGYNSLSTSISFNVSGCALAPPSAGVPNLFTILPNFRFGISPPPSATPDYTWTPSIGLSNNVSANPIALPTETRTYVLEAIYNNGCVHYDTVTVFVGDMQFTKSPDVSICSGSNVDIFATSDIATVHHWDTSKQGLSCYNCANPTASPDSTTTYYVTVTGSNGCVIYDSITVTVADLTADAIFRDTLVDQADLVNLGAIITGGTSGDYTYTWTPSTYLDNPNALNPTSTPLEDMVYTLTVVSGDCQDTTLIKVRVNIIASPVIMPDAFTPNADGYNDYYYPVIEGLATVKEFKIYNRWGEIVHNNPDDGWYGKLRGGADQPIGTYTYVVVIERPLNDDEVIQGAFNLLR